MKVNLNFLYYSFLLTALIILTTSVGTEQSFRNGHLGGLPLDPVSRLAQATLFTS